MKLHVLSIACSADGNDHLPCVEIDGPTFAGRYDYNHHLTHYVVDRVFDKQHVLNVAMEWASKVGDKVVHRSGHGGLYKAKGEKRPRHFFYLGIQKPEAVIFEEEWLDIIKLACSTGNVVWVEDTCHAAAEKPSRIHLAGAQPVEYRVKSVAPFGVYQEDAADTLDDPRLPKGLLAYFACGKHEYALGDIASGIEPPYQGRATTTEGRSLFTYAWLNSIGTSHRPEQTFYQSQNAMTHLYMGATILSKPGEVQHVRMVNKDWRGKALI